MIPSVRRRAGSAFVRTSILRPSTMVPFSFSRARSASALVSKVTNPKPCEWRREREKEREFGKRDRQKEEKRLKRGGGGDRAERRDE